MAITFSTTLRNARADAITTDAGTSAKLRLYTAAYAAIVAELICNATAFAGAAASGTLVLNTITTGTATLAGTNTAVLARIYRSNGSTMVIEGLSVGTSGSNINLTNNVIAQNDTVTATSGQIVEGNP